MPCSAACRALLIGLAIYQPAVAAAAAAGFSATASDPASPAIVAAFEAGRLSTALNGARALLQEAPSESATRQARLVEAFALLRLRRLTESQRALDALSEDDPGLGPYLTFLRAGVVAARRDCQNAERLTLELPDESVFITPSWGQAASCWMGRHDPKRAEAALERMRARAETEPRRADAILLRARLAESRGDRRTARDLYREVLVGYPLTPAGRTASARLLELKRRGLIVKPLLPEELLPRAESERSHQLPSLARETYASVIAASKGRRRASLRQAAELGLAELDIVDRRYNRAAQRVEGVLREGSQAAIRAHALFLKADIFSRHGSLSEALDTYDQIVNELGDAPFAGEAALAGARLAYAARQTERARSFANRLLASTAAAEPVTLISNDGAHEAGASPDELRAQAAWLLAWTERRNGSPAPAMDSYLAQIPASSSLAPAATYWRARLAVDMGEIAGAEVFASLVVERAPTSYYSLAAADLVARANPSCAVQIDLPDVDPNKLTRPLAARDLSGALVLYEHGLKSEAERLVRLVPVVSLAGADCVAAAWLYRRCGDYYRSATLTRRAADQAVEPWNPVVLELAYPRAYAEAVSAAASEHNLPSELIYAVMRQESAFNPRAVSPRYARGLMQMIRPTAKRMAAEADLHRFQTRHLFDPKVSVRLGAQYLAGLLERYDGNVVAAIAAYHAGESAVDRWLRTRHGLAADELIEEIPYSSTRGYIKKVLASYGIYRLLYDSEKREALPLFLADLGGDS